MLPTDQSKIPTYRGTTTVGLLAKDAVVLATDTRVTAGYLFIAHRRGKKIYQIDDHLAMTIAGGVADAQNVVDILRYNAGIYKLERKQPIPVKSAARLIANVFFSARLFPYIAEVIVGGYDEEGPRLINVDLFGSLNEGKYLSTGSGSPVAYGILEDEYVENAPVADSVALAAKAVAAAIKRNAGTGDSIDIAVIDSRGFKELPLKEKQKLMVSILGRP